MRWLSFLLCASCGASAAARPPALPVDPDPPPTACPSVSPSLRDEGAQVFGGAGNCHTCHGPAGKGTPLGPDLTDDTWLHGDGSYASIAEIARDGVPKPLKHPEAMPPRGGGALSDEQVCAAAAWVWSLSHPAGSNTQVRRSRPTLAPGRGRRNRSTQPRPAHEGG